MIGCGQGLCGADSAYFVCVERIVSICPCSPIPCSLAANSAYMLLCCLYALSQSCFVTAMLV